MRVLVKKWGNNASIRIPAAVVAASDLTIDQAVDMREEGGRIIIEPVRENELETLLAGITSDNLPVEIDFGPAVGKEAF